MSYDIRIMNIETGESYESPRGMLQFGSIIDLNDAEMYILEASVTYNYSKFFEKAFNTEKGVGIRVLHGKNVKESSTLLLDAINNLSNDGLSDNYWEATEGNARRSLIQLLNMGLTCPEGFWEIN